jgi:hypothetical protein
MRRVAEGASLASGKILVRLLRSTLPRGSVVMQQVHGNSDPWIEDHHLGRLLLLPWSNRSQGGVPLWDLGEVQGKVIQHVSLAEGEI